MDDNGKYRDFLGDLIKEINSIALDETMLEETSFNRGYRAGIRVILAVIEHEMRAFQIEDADLDAKLINVDEWFRLGRDYRPET